MFEYYSYDNKTGEAAKMRKLMIYVMEHISENIIMLTALPVLFISFKIMLNNTFYELKGCSPKIVHLRIAILT